MAPVDDTTVDLAELAYDRMLTNAERALEVAENRLIRAQSRLENVMTHLGERHRWAGKTQAEIFGEITDELLEVHLIVTGGTK